MTELGEIEELLVRIYGETAAAEAFSRIRPLIEGFPARASEGRGFFSENDVVLITYGDSLGEAGEVPLATLHRFAGTYLKDIFSAIHLLPFFPYSSDDGFSVLDFFEVDPAIGSWDRIEAIRKDFDLMFDFVLNHISAGSDWFARYLAEAPGFDSLAIEVDPSIDLSGVTRPRALPLLTAFRKKSGHPVHVWTTFSADQVDLNYKSIDVLERMIEVFLHYVKMGARLLRLDAVAYLWKEIGTPCIHLEQTHAMVSVFRKILDIVAPDVAIITETNVPHSENISYFGSGTDEAQMVYNFALPPLLLHTFISGNSDALSKWASGLTLDSETSTFFNFTASHDGIGVRPLEGILPPEALRRVIAAVCANGGRVSVKKNPDGSESPYELNITYFDAMGEPGRPDDPLHVDRFLASQAVGLVLPGVPAVYIHSILGSRNWSEGVEQTGRARTINREKPALERVVADLENPGTLCARIFRAYSRMIRVRRRQPAFHPNARFEILDLDSRAFAISRTCPDERLLAITNIGRAPLTLSLADREWPAVMIDLISGKPVETGTFHLKPYGVVWLHEKTGG